MGPLARLLLAIAGISAIGLGLASMAYVPPKAVSLYDFLTLRVGVPNYTYVAMIQPMYIIDNYTMLPARIKSSMFTAFAVQLWNRTVYISSPQPVKLIIYEPAGAKALEAARVRQRVVVVNGTVAVLAPAAVIAIYPAPFELVVS